MTRFRLFLLTAIIVAAPSIANAQAFSKDDRVGAEQTFVTTEAAGWVSDRTTYRIVGKEESAARTTLILSQKSSIKADKDSTPIETTLTVKILYTPNSIVIPKENFSSSLGMVEEMFPDKKIEMSFSGDDPSMPNSLSVGQKLPDSEVKATITVEGINAKMSIKGTDRRITARERVTVPAGSFDAFVLEESATVKVTVLILSQSEKTTEKSWIVPGMGEVKAITYDKKGKLSSTTEMTSYTK